MSNRLSSIRKSLHCGVPRRSLVRVGLRPAAAAEATARLLVVEEDPHRGRLEVVELPGPRGPDEEADGDGRDEQREREQDEDRLHVRPPSLPAPLDAGR